MSYKLNRSLAFEKDLIDTTYKSIIHEYTTHADILFENVINQEENLILFSQAVTSPDITRASLYAKLQPMYENMSTFKLRQLHFHLPNNESFLRFHRPSKYGDNLSGIRATVEHVNYNYEKMSGFEEGRIYNGYRFVYPLSYAGEHLGSVETSISMESVVASLKNALDADVEFILDMKVVKEKVFKDEKSNYKEYEAIPNHVIDKNIEGSEIIQSILKQNNNFYTAHIMAIEKEVVNLFDVMDSKAYIISIVTIKKVFTEEPIAHILLLREHPELYYLQIQRLLVASILILLIGLVLFYMYKAQKRTIIIEQKNEALLLSKEKFKKLFNLQRNIMVVSDGKKIKMANNAMCNFFGIDYIEFFTKYHSDISQRFIEHESYFNLTEVEGNKTWIEAIEPLIGDKRIVMMHDLHNNPHAFNVSVSRYEGEDYIILFTDISATMLEKVTLTKKLMKDTLTNALSREFFTQNINSIIHHIKTDMHLGVSILDIDHFKIVNDTFGHDVGDTVLKELTHLVQTSIRESDYFIRWGGEEFVILTHTSSLESLERAIEHVRSRIESTTFTIIKNLTCSLGTTLYINGEDIKDTIVRADKALYQAKGKNRNQVVVL